MKPKILFINSVCGYGSTGRIVAELSKIDGFETLVCFGRKKNYANVNSYKFANFFDNAFAAFRTILFDNNLNICTIATKKLIKKIKEYNPDIIHLHNLHGYYLNIELLFKFLKEYNKPVIWTLHDCWPMTGYCAHFDSIGCDKYKTKCENCPHGFSYPFSIFKQNVTKDYLLKKELFNSINNLTIITPSKWLENIVKKSYLINIKTKVINNGIELDKFDINDVKDKDFTVLAVASVWSKEKGIDELNKMIPLLDKNIKTIVIGKNSDKINSAISLERTSDFEELKKYYSTSHLFINMTLEENFPTVNIESLACGTPVITYNTGGSTEIIDDKSGVVVEKGNYIQMAKVINEQYKNYSFNNKNCIARAKQFSKENMLNKYKELYESLLAK